MDQPISVLSARLLNLRENRDGTLINLAGLPRKVRMSVQIAYSIYALLLAGFVLAVAIMAIFDVNEVQLEPEDLAAIGLALIGPLVPFARKISLPGGTAVDLAAPPSIAVLVQGEKDFQAQLAEMDLDALAIGE